MDAKYLGITTVRGVIKDRWECPNCVKNNSPERRFNLSKKRAGSKHICRFCKTELELNYVYSGV